jgi:hypothetical protein
MCKPTPIQILESWFNQYLNPKVEKIGANFKQSTSFNSSGIEIFLSPDINKKFKPVIEKDITISEFSDKFLADILRHEQHKVFIESATVIDNPLSEEELAKLQTDYPEANYSCKRHLFLSYSGSQILLKFRKFDIKFNSDTFSNYCHISKFLYFQAKKISNEASKIEVAKINEDKSDYFWFLLDILFQCSDIQE